MTIKSAYLGGGCFWCTEAVFQQLKGVTAVRPGYAGGQTASPNYQQVCQGKTGHAEVLKIDFDPSIISFEKLLEVFFVSHDPTTLNRQGNDIGTQYRSIILYTDEEQKKEAEAMINSLRREFDLPIVTELRPLVVFYEAEEYHHDFFHKNPEMAYCQLVINPKLQKLKTKYAGLLKD